jgi:Secretion system C-terminal sorting domain
MRKLLFFCFIFLFGNQLLHSQTTLVAGDIAIVGYNADEVGNEDEFSFILLRDITAGTVIRFTDFGWASDINGFQSANPCGAGTGSVSDGAITWTAPAGGLLCGTQVHVVCGGLTLSASAGTVVGLVQAFNFPGEFISLSPGGDQIFAFQGSLAAPTLITAISMNGAWDTTLLNCTFTATASVLPAALNATTSVQIIPERDNARYNCTVTNDSPTNLRTAIFNVANWNTDDAVPYILPLTCTFSCSSCTSPTVPTVAATSPICAGGSSTLTITGTLNSATAWHIYSGSCGGTLVGTTATSTFVVSPGATTTYFVRGEGGCVTPGSCGSTIVNVTNPPTAGTLSGTQNICVGLTTTFSSTQTGGAWSTSNAATATVNSTTGVITGVSAGTATITYTVAGTGGCPNATAIRTVTVTAAPTAGTLSGTQNICVGLTTTFSSTQIGGVWSTSSAAIATVNATTGVITGVSDGTATITYTVAGTGGCPNATATRTVTVTASSNNTTTIAACDSYTWINNGQTYTASGVYTGTTTNCVTEILNLTITPSSNNTTTIAACNSYTWTNNGQTYTASGTYTGTTTNCVTEILNLTITPSSDNTTTITACDSYTWANNGQTYTSSGTYTGTTTNCVTEILNLTITPSSNNTTTIAACDSYTWANNGQTYTTSGTYTGTTTNCVTEILNLTITPSSNNITTITACDSYTWANNGQTYTTSGTYTGTTTNCVTEILNLTITPSSNNTTTIAACDSYTWANNGQTYTTSGTYTGTTTNCMTEILNLTITPSSNNTTIIEATENYTWAVNGVTYTTSGTYTFVNGCVTEILNLTIGTGVTNVIATQCGSTLTDYNSVIYANLVPGAQRYRFRVTDLETNQVIIKDYALRNLYLKSLSFYRYNQAYSIEVAVRRNNIWEPYGAACTVSTPVASTQVRASQCGSTLTTSSDLVYADYVYATTSYRFRITNTSTNSVQIIDRPIRAFTFSLVTDYSIGTVYNVDIAVMNTDGTYLPFGSVCTVTTPGALFKELTTKSVVDVFEVSGIPNPFSENFKLNVTSSSVEPISISVYDMLGKLIETKEVSTNDIENFEAGVNYPNGVYNIIVTQGDNVKSVRMIKR